MKTSQRQILQNGEEESTCSPQDSPASRSAWPDNERERMMTATSGRRLSELYVKPGPLGSLERTLLESSRWFSPARKLRWEAVALCSEKVTEKEYWTEKEYCYGRNTSSKPSAVTLNEKVTKSGRLLFRLVPSERPTGGTGCGLLPTVQTQGLKVCNAEGKTEFMPLELLPTPTSIDSGSGRINKSPLPGAKERPTIALAAKMGLLPTPMSTEVRHEQRVKELKEAGGQTFHSRKNGETRPNGLTDFLDFHGMLLTPSASDGMRANFTMESLKRHNKKNAENSNLSEQIAHKVNGGTSQLNPLFVTEMMGFPLDWLVSPFQNGERNQ